MSPDPIKVTLEQCVRLLAPLAKRVFNDNGDVSVTGTATYDEVVDAYFAHKAATAALAQLPQEGEQADIPLKDGWVAVPQEVLDSLHGEEPFIFDPATFFCHDPGNEGLDHGTLWTPSEPYEDEARASHPQQGGWQSMESAPKDKRILVSSPLFGGIVIGAKWDEDSYSKKPRPFWALDIAHAGVTAMRKYPPNGWMPLPPAAGGEHG